MNFLKGLAIGLLSLLLFLSLIIFGLALTLNNTILNPKFITSELDILPVSSLAEEIISEQITEEEFPEELGTALVNTITKLEPLVKEQVSAATYPIFDYLRGKSQSIDLAHTLHNTILNPDFVASVVDELDVSSLVGGIISEQIPEEELPEEMRTALVDTIAELEPWIKEQVRAAADPVVDYLLGESQSLNVVISLESMKETLRDNLREAFLSSLPPELAGAPQADLERIFDEFYLEFSAQIPATFEFDESVLGAEIPSNIAGALMEAEEALGQARQYVGYFQLGFKALIGFIVLLILGIILINRRVRGTTRVVGTTFLIYGAAEYGSILAVKNFVAAQMAKIPIPEMPSSLHTWILQSLNNFLSPLEMFSLGLLIGGVVLLIVSFVYKRRQPSY